MTATVKFFKEVNSIFDQALSMEKMPKGKAGRFERRCDECGKALYFMDIAVPRGDGRICEGCHGRPGKAESHA